MTRLNNTLIGIAGGTALSPAMYKFNKTMVPALKSGYSNIGKAIDDGEFAKDLNIVQRSIAAPIRPAYSAGKKATDKF